MKIPVHHEGVVRWFDSKTGVCTSRELVRFLGLSADTHGAVLAQRTGGGMEKSVGYYAAPDEKFEFEPGSDLRIDIVRLGFEEEEAF